MTVVAGFPCGRLRGEIGQARSSLPALACKLRFRLPLPPPAKLARKHASLPCHRLPIASHPTLCHVMPCHAISHAPCPMPHACLTPPETPRRFLHTSMHGATRVPRTIVLFYHHSIIILFLCFHPQIHNIVLWSMKQACVVGLGEPQVVMCKIELYKCDFLGFNNTGDT